jgi:hypothetical protein
MFGKNKERWHELCEQASTEQDPNKLRELGTEINRLLEEKRTRLRAEHESRHDAHAEEGNAGLSENAPEAL